MLASKPWTWKKATKQANEYWDHPADEFLPIIKRWGEKNYKRALDLGCGTGRHSILLAKEGFEVDAFDLSSDGIEIFREKIKNHSLAINIQIGDMLALPYDENTFDCIVAFHTIHHTDMQGLQKTLKDIYKLLKPGGEAFITLASKESDSWQKNTNEIINNSTFVKTEGPEIGVPHTYLDYNEVIDILKDFSIIKIQQIINYLRQQNKKHAHFFILVKK